MKLRNYSPILVFFLMLFFLNPASADDLLDIYEQALSQDALYAAAQAQQRVGDEREIQGRSGLLPQISFDTQTSWSDTQYEVLGGRIGQRRQNRGYGIQLLQPLFRWQNWIQYKHGRLEQALSEVRLEQAHQTLMIRVAETYFHVLNSKDVQDAVERLHLADAEQLTSARKHFELGNVSIADVHEAQASYDSTAALQIKARSDLVLARHVLAKITGRLPESIQDLRGHVVFERPVPDKVEIWIAAAREESLEVQTQEILLNMASNEVKNRKAAYLPVVDLVLNQTMQQNPNANTESSDSRSIGLRLSMPLYTGGRLSSAEREALALEARSGYELEEARRVATYEVYEAWSGVTDGIARVSALEAAKVSAQSSVESNQLGYKVGVRIGMDVLLAQSRLSETIQQLSRARYDTLLAHLRLKATVGTLGRSDLVKINGLLAYTVER